MRAETDLPYPCDRIYRESTSHERLPAMHCFSCGRDIVTVAVWLGETYDGVEQEWPFCESCADGAWPLYETRRQRLGGSCHCPAARGEACPLSHEDCAARTLAAVSAADCAVDPVVPDKD